MQQQPIHFIVNPISGHVNKKSIVELIKKELDTERFSPKILYTEYAGHAAELTQQAVEQSCPIIVAVGGDGTINEVASHLIGTPSALGIIPCGSGNGLARHLRIPMNPKSAIQVINEAKIHCLDYGMIDGHPFFCTCGVGFDAVISKRFAQSKSRGPKSYIENVLKESLTYRSQKYNVINADNETTHKAFLIAAANASQYGNNAYIAPHASMKDGLLDIIILKPFTPFDIPQMLFQLFNRRLDQNSHIERIQTSKVIIEREEPGAIHCDGDPFAAGKRIEIKIIPQQFHVVSNEKAKKNTNVIQLITEDAIEWWNTKTEYLQRQQKKLQKVNRILKQKFGMRHTTHHKPD